MSAELYSVANKHYFTYNGNIFKLTAKQLKYALTEIKKENIYNPLASAIILIKMAKDKKFKNLTIYKPSRNEILNNVLKNLK